ncbi:Trimethylguanosine synthase [Diplonema papillatum]|nr:Trimethylguanosine synthase [Diplonema papillatum]
MADAEGENEASALTASDNDDDDSDTVSAFSDEPGFEVTDDGTLLVRKSEGTLAKKNEGTGYDAVKFSNRKAYPHLFKYWTQRYRFWSRFDRGVWMDEESWYSVTPEAIAKHIAERCQSVRHDVVIDGFCGAGGNTIQFAKIAKSVIAFDIDPAKLAIARHNARVYGVDHKIEFILGDFTKMIPTLEADIVFLSPPWGGPRYNLAAYFDLADIQLTKEKRYNGFDLFRDVTHFTARNIIYYLPRNVLADQLASLVPVGETYELERNLMSQKVKSVTAYFGDFPALSRNPVLPVVAPMVYPPELVEQARILKRKRAD